MKSSKRLFLTAADTVVGEGDPKGVRLLVGTNGEISDADMKKYGLTAADLAGDGQSEEKPAPAPETSGIKSDFRALGGPVVAGPPATEPPGPAVPAAPEPPAPAKTPVAKAPKKPR